MSAAVGIFSASKQDGLKKNGRNNNEEAREEKKKKNKKFVDDNEAKNNNVDDENEVDEEDDNPKLKPEKELDLGPPLSLKEQLEKDKDDESLRRWKEQLLGSVDMSALGGTVFPICYSRSKHMLNYIFVMKAEMEAAEVKIERLSIVCRGRPDIVLPIPFVSNPKSSLFILKEGSPYRLKFSFTVSHNVVSGLNYTNTVWKTGVKVEKTKVMLGTFSPRKDPYTYELEEETTPSGLFARGSYSATTKLVDDDGKAYLAMNYHFEIKKNWPSNNS
ncbi:rho GDP-dissociation inhibitor 1 isoform X1 [Gossypium hirsutum]|uniref:Rho GDP-dissociation inhibitor 1 isoform X1 n=1 Tax=Gossypium hirsutum TaxID=3635 RepID=A0ABM2YRF0_GOSHI|nr:rho GDP-dissociation inhibitor 1-like isoform X1 [Gossypium hirsutum]